MAPGTWIKEGLGELLTKNLNNKSGPFAEELYLLEDGIIQHQLFNYITGGS